ncbi:hypothetical protein G6F37_004663 [Rhizopus arrhizus]|nr:hypothetical protein G6F38_004885 [Rhizopus arrhizus]KAG1159682.1 hypothetical protein G6F37_004663 [Rhizopus arrhizus]
MSRANGTDFRRHVQCHPDIPEELYDHLGTNNHTISDPFFCCSEYACKIFDIANNNDLTDKDLKEAIETQAINNNSSEEYAKAFFGFIMTFFKKNSVKKIAINEAFFNYVFVWPMVELSAETTNNSDISFVPGEYILHSSVEEYKADAVVLLEQYDVELCLVETSGAYKINDAPRFGYDHVKGCFGALTLLNAIIKKYHNAKLDSILRLVIPFVHIRGDSVHLWGLELCSEKLYAFKKLYKCQIPTSWEGQESILSTGVLFYNLAKMLRNLAEQVKIICKEHNGSKASTLLGTAPQKDEVDLLKFIDTSIKKPARGSNYGILLPLETEVCNVKFERASSV